MPLVDLVADRQAIYSDNPVLARVTGVSIVAKASNVTYCLSSYLISLNPSFTAVYLK
ncbi:hypothetical protein [Proteus mirabilis]|uniref:hypothetical protein n=1 Tax=Proteus mirabilis TaxID=584 RepID=UPI001583F3E5|nr:hypothetical protein [Proteus mirabilis]MBG2816095.1 hypothetical protein [Proteus mirabilis]MDC9761029.1 hypothetical protein [Proteus mirabilis]MDF7216650.1 hypothetical protein [Proteus mirabilis]MDF7259262.1 hypothetical protein [Proteus mirabilis]MDF7295910.1 hypothetical protein [Proteus mirabilis]